MKASLAVDESDHLNFFCLYDGCLMDVAVISWCKLFGSERENLHWSRLFPAATEPHARIKAADGDMKSLSDKIRQYRDTYVAHHDLDETKRAKFHPELRPLRTTGQVLYREVYSALNLHGHAGGLPHPDQITGPRLQSIEAQWKVIAATARAATQELRDS